MIPPEIVKNAMNIENQRGTTRIKMTLPIHVTGYNGEQQKWSEMSRVLDVSRLGASFLVHHPVSPGLVLYLSFPMPWRLRQFAHSDPSYKIYAVVRNSAETTTSAHRIGVEFLGQNPPKTYLDKPWTIFNPREWKGSERRRAVRKSMQEPVWVEYYRANEEMVGLEQGVTENISKTGARICVQEPPLEFETVKIFVLGKSFESFASVVNQFIGKDGLQRLCVNFLQKEWQS